MSSDTMHSRLSRRLTTLVAALVIASIATVTTAAGVLAVKAPPAVLFETATPACVYDDDKVRAVVDVRFDGHGRWVYVEAWAEATDAAGHTISGTLFVGDRYDMKTSTPVEGFPLLTDNGPVTTYFLVRIVDRRTRAPQAAWTWSETYTCP